MSIRKSFHRTIATLLLATSAPAGAVLFAPFAAGPAWAQSPEQPSKLGNLASFRIIAADGRALLDKAASPDPGACRSAVDEVVATIDRFAGRT